MENMRYRTLNLFAFVGNIGGLKGNDIYFSVED